MRSSKYLVLAVLACAQTSRARADEVTLQSSQDTTIYESNAGLSNGEGMHMFSGMNGRRSRRRALLAFDIARSVPAGAKITQAVLTLQLTRGQARATAVAVHRVLAAWGEGDSRAAGEEGGGAAAGVEDATWSHRSWPSVTWRTPGGDFTPEVSATTRVIDLGEYTWQGPALTRDVQDFLDKPSENHGWILIGDAEPSPAAKRFDTREASDQGPQLTLTYDRPAGTTGACCFADGSCGVKLAATGRCDGKYLGDATQCSPGACPEPTGACCNADAAASCAIKARSECGRESWHAAASCDPNPCPVVLTPFVDALPLPAAATPVSGRRGGAAAYRMRMIQLTQQLHRDLPATKVWGYHDGSTGGYPGPTIVARSGEPVAVTWVNDLRDEAGNFLKAHALPVDACLHGATSDAPRGVVHLHGGHVASKYDGQPELTLLPGAETRYEYPNQQRAATLWYHDHAVGITRLNVIMGLAGFYIVTDAEEEKLGLPSGKYDIGLAIQDRSFNPDGSFRYPTRWQGSFFGNTPLVNGKVSPYLEVDRGVYRFRVLNGSTSRVYTLSRSSGQSFIQIGTDGGLLPESFATKEVTIAPGERADIVIDFAYAGPEETLDNSARAPFPNGGEGVALTSLMKFIVKDTPGYTEPVPVKLSNSFTPLDTTNVLERELVLDRAANEDACGHVMWMINDKHWHEITEHPHLGTTEIWRFVNRSRLTHPMHMHLLFFQVLDRQAFTLDDTGAITLSGPRQAPQRGERGWKDTVQVGPLEIVRVAARFEDFEGRYPYHCHLLEHEDHGMMRQFETKAVCGDAALAKGFEECDDGNERNGDGCDSACKLERSGDAGRRADGEPASSRSAADADAGPGPELGGSGGRPAHRPIQVTASPEPHASCSTTAAGARDRHFGWPWALAAAFWLRARVRRRAVVPTDALNACKPRRSPPAANTRARRVVRAAPVPRR